jgi:phosphoribosylformimino-5-aminoimidazole carboxamide ribotide isomerase
VTGSAHPRVPQSVQLYPAIDIRFGRLARAGRPADPLATAKAWVRAGAGWLHVVDLDRAAGGKGTEGGLIRVLAALPGVSIQLGGGLTRAADVAEALDWGVRRVVLGGDAMATLGALTREVDPERLAIALDVRGQVPAPQAIERIVAAGIRHVVYRDLDRDGALQGADLAGAVTLVGRGADVILAGGVASLDELKAARRAGVAGVIVGRALLEGRFTLEEALACCG